ncbi:MAG: glycosyltransferase family 4 protein [Actinomycetia bacterium]|nr:glycosyltransferase family 4 protein [Actinomycetes bacterium]
MNYDAESVVEALRQNGFKVTIGALDYMKKIPEPPDFPVKRIGTYVPYALEKSPVKKALRMLITETFNPTVLFRILNLLRKEGCDVIILFQSVQIGFAPYLASRILGIPIYIRNDWICPARSDEAACGFLKRVRECGDCLEVKMGIKLGGFTKYVVNILSALYGAVKSWLWRRAAGALPVSQWHSNQFEGYGVPPERWTIIHPDRQIREFPVADKPFTELKDNDSLKVLFVGRLEKDKGVDLLLGGFEKAIGEHPDLQLLVAGEGTLRPLVEEYVSKHDQITYLGWLDEAGLSQAYQVSDVVVIPTFVLEGYGLVASEAASFDKVIVWSDSGGMKEVLDTYEKGVRLHEVSVDSLCEAISNIAIERDRGGHA